MTAQASSHSVSRRVVAVLAVVVAAAALLIGLPGERAAAANAADWDPGYIIDDAVFYDSAGMSAGQVQTFLNSRVATCRSGATCLKDYAQSTSNIAADSYCSGYTASGRETAAQIIDKVARSCGINQRALIVLLEKEQGLVSSTAPSSWNYAAATGQGCPDTAPCDPNTAGFFYQMYYGARQFKVYKAHPTSFGYIAQRWNNILYNPSASCGTKRVFIHNQATAALYVYTPYTPNDSALANMYGTGDGCASYGNRNFWRTYTDWFGDPRTFTVLDGFTSYWNANGGANGKIGSPVSYAVFVEQNGQGWYQRFQGGTVYGSYFGGTVFVPKGSHLDEYNVRGGPSGAMSWPNGESICTAGGRCSQSFVGAWMSSTSTYGAHVLWGGVRDHWLAQGGNAGTLGAALNDMTQIDTMNGTAWVQNFEAGVLAQSAYGFRVVAYGPSMDVWQAAGGARGWMGWPTDDRTCLDGDCAQSFTGAVITSNPRWGTFAISGGFVSAWRDRGGLSGIGAAYNAMSAAAGGGGWSQNFARGIMAQGPLGAYEIPYGPAQALWSGSGAEHGTYGWPVTQRECLSTGECAQRFMGGSITESTAWGVHGTFGGLGSAWRQNGGISTFGPALNDIRYAAVNGGGWAQHFGTGIFTQQTTGQPVYTPYGSILSIWYNYGAEATWLGWPAGPQTCSAGACVQPFQNGVARSSSTGAVSFSAS